MTKKYKITGATGKAASWVESKIGPHDSLNHHGHKSWSGIPIEFYDECWKLKTQARKSYFEKNELRFEYEKGSSVYIQSVVAPFLK
tara:strand:+ start:404 stop:661 length:258 start_codon:yes stop_codon:yes gene_type:complete